MTSATARTAKPADVRAFEARFGVLGGVERRDIGLGKPTIRSSGAGSDQFTVKGHASVFNKPSMTLGWFTEYVDPKAFDRVLTENPDVFLLQDHDTLRTLARTKNGTLDLKTDGVGLAYWARVNSKLTYAADLRIALETGLIDQASFAFTVARDKWDEQDDGTMTRTILEVGDLYDVSICAMGAYPDASSELVRSIFRNYSHERMGDATSARAKLKLRAAASARNAKPNKAVATAKLKARARAARSRV